jgi:alpha-galactosidase
MASMRIPRDPPRCLTPGRRGRGLAAGAALSILIATLLWVPDAGALRNGLARTPPMGWNPWYRFRCNVNEDLIRRTADIMVSSGMKAAGYRYVNLDDCWMARTRDPSGSLAPDPAKFPHGIRALADYVHSKGLKFGIYADAGGATCQGFPGSRGHFDQDARTFAAWAVDYLKLDGCNTTPAELGPAGHAAMLASLRRARRPVLFSIASFGGSSRLRGHTPWRWGARVANMWRTTHDFTWYRPRRRTWDGVMEVVDINARLSRYAHPGGWNDPDLLQVGNWPLGAREGRSIFSLWAIMAAPLIADNDLRTMSAFTRQTLTNREVIAIDQDPAGIQGTRVRTSAGREVWVRRLANGDRALLLFSRRATPGKFAVDLASLGLGGGDRHFVRDLWTHRTATVGRVLRATVVGHGVAMFRIRAG